MKFFVNPLSIIQSIYFLIKYLKIYDMKKVISLFLILFCLVPAAFAGIFEKKSAKLVIPESSGYVGTLPNIESGFPKPDSEQTNPAFEYKDGFNDPYNIKPVPRDNPSFVNIIMKKDKTSAYINDLNYIIAIIEDLQTDIENSQNVQKFNAESYFLKENVEYFRDKYRNKAEGSYISFRKLMQLNTHVQSIAQLRLESEAYSPYLAAQGSGNLFTSNNIDNQLDYLLKDIKSTLVVLKETR